MEFGNVNETLALYGFKDEQVRQYCNSINGDQSVYKNCYYRVDDKLNIDSDLLNKWQSMADKLAKQLDENQWSKLPNLDPVTNNPVESLDRLLEYKGTYSANVTYEKSLDKATCEITLEVSPADTTNSSKASLKITKACNSIDKNWL